MVAWDRESDAQIREGINPKEALGRVGPGKTFETSGPVALRILEDIRYYVEVPDTDSAEHADCANKSGKVSSVQHNIGKPGRDA